MIVSAQVAIYPLRQDRLTPAITAVSRALEAARLRPEIGPMSTTVTGEAATVFRALEQAFAQAGTLGHVVMTVTISNACPVGP
ncbi:MAG: thiamine-binding protein [Candidatus Rokubacteria bacterium]|nr:thiamine-binding protein [Candidatus Rokubacteria bacterium]MBI2494346.1 thiamine-binding protein [Candidatus Rokubacteria bacterium]